MRNGPRQRQFSKARQGHGRLAYGQAALAGDAARVANATTGTRYHTLGGSSYRLGRLIASGEIDHDQARRMLWAAAKVCGYIDDHGATTVKKEIESGLQAGALNPRTPGPRIWVWRCNQPSLE
jgi:hypothetical protein